jgi:hypothetical protein
MSQITEERAKELHAAWEAAGVAERLRLPRQWWVAVGAGTTYYEERPTKLELAAADEIERLRESMFKTLVRLDEIALALLSRIDQTTPTDDRTSYADGYAGGIRDAVQAMRQFVVDECPDFHERAAKMLPPPTV